MPLSRGFKETVQRASGRTANTGRNSSVEAWNLSWPEISILEKRFCATTLMRRLGLRNSVASRNDPPEA